MLGSIADRTILSVDWDPRTLRLVHARIGKGSVTIDQALSIPIPSQVRMDEAGSLGGFIARAVHQAGIATKRAVVDIPRDQVNFYTLSLPNASLNDLAGMVAFQIPKELPFPVDLAVVDFTAPLDSEGEVTDVLVAAVRKEVLKLYVEVFEHAGLKLQRVGLRANANQFAINELLRTTPHDRVLFVDVGPSTTEIDVLRQGRLVFSRAADVEHPPSFDEKRVQASTPGTDEGQTLTLVTTDELAESALDRVVRELTIEVRRSIEAYRVGEPGAVIDHAVIGGSSGVEQALAEAIQKEHDITAQPYNPAVCFGWDSDRGAAAGAFASALGLVLAQTKDPQLKFNFLEPKKPISRAERQIKKAPLAVAVAVVFVVAGVAFYINWIKPQYETRAWLRGQIAEVDTLLDEHRDFRKLVSVLENYEDQQIVWIDELRDLMGVLPGQRQLVLGGIDMSQKEHRIKMPFRAKAYRTGSEAVAAIEAFRLPGVNRPQYRASPGPSNVKTKKEYPHNGRLDIDVVDRDWTGDKKKEGRRRRR